MNELTEISMGLALLQQAEAMAIEGAGHWMQGQNEVAIALHKIVTQKLYLEIKDDQGLPEFKTFENYWPSLEKKMGISRSQAFNVLRDIRIALGPSFGLDYETFVRLGGVTRFSAVPEVAEYNQKTGEVYGLKEGYELPEGESVSTFIIDHMQRYAPSTDEQLNLNITEYKQSLKDALATGVKVEVEWFLVEVKAPEGMRYRTKWERRFKEGDETVNQDDGHMDDPNVPLEVLEVYKRRLPVVGIYKFSG